MNTFDHRSRARRSRVGSGALSPALVVAVAVSLGASCGRAATQAATPQTFYAKVQAARPGDVVQLAAGDYGAVKFYGRKVAEPGIRIEPKPGAKVVFSGLTLENSEGIALNGLEIAMQANPLGLNIQSSSRIRVSNLDVHALLKTPSNAIMLRDSHDLTVSNCEVHDVGTGINFIESEHVKIAGNRIHNVQVDAIRGTGSYIEVVGNSGSSFHPAPGDHPDFIQFWGSKSGVATGNVIKDNVIERGDGAPFQGIFIEYNQNITIAGNAMVGTMYNGISLSDVKGGLIENNFVQGFPDMGVQIIVRGASPDVIVRNNVAERIVNYDRDGVNPRYKEEHNTLIRAARAGDTTAMKSWVVKHQAR